MDKFFFRRQDSDTQQGSRVPADRQIFRGILSWLVALIRFPTEEELQDAGIFRGNRHSR